MFAMLYNEERHKKSEAKYNQAIGEERGVKIGEIRHSKKSIFKNLSRKGSISPELTAFIQSQDDADTLNHWEDFAIDAATLSEFNQAIGFVR